MAAVRLAAAEACVATEIEVRKADPKSWLSRKHPGTPDKPGWSDPATRVELTGKDGTALVPIILARQILEVTGEDEK